MTHELWKQGGADLKECRRELDLTLSEAADLLGLKRLELLRMELGIIEPATPMTLLAEVEL